MSQSPVTALVPVRRTEKIVRTVPGEVVPYVKPKKSTPKYKNYQWRNGVWYLRIWIDGYLLYKSTDYADITNAKKKGEQLIKEYKEARDKLGVFGKCPKLRDWWKTYEKSHTAAKACADHDIRALTAFVEAPYDGGTTYGDLRLNQFTKEICQQYINERQRMLSAIGTPYADNTIRLEVSKIKAVFNAAMPTYLVWSPMNKIVQPKETLRLRVLEGEEQTRFLRVLTSDEMRRLVKTLIGCGLRRKEVLGHVRTGLAGLRPCDVTEGTVFVRADVAKRKKARTVDIQRWVYDLLDQQRQARGLPWNSEASLWLLNPNTAAVRMAQTSDRLGLTDPVTLHDLRRTFITCCLRAGMNTKLVADLVGHSNTKIIDQYYNALNRHDTRAALAKVRFGCETEGESGVSGIGQDPAPSPTGR